MTYYALYIDYCTLSFVRSIEIAMWSTMIMGLLVLGALRTARSLKWGRGGTQSILNMEICIDVHVVLLTYIRILNHQQLSDRSACIP